jgi:hypothetical protein
MIRSIGLHTYEIDDADVAVAQLHAQLETFALMDHTVGVIMCDPEYLDSGVYEAVCAALPFPVAGTTTMTQAVNGETGLLMLTVYVMTGDDVFFSVGCTGALPRGGDAYISSREAYETARRFLPACQDTKLIFAFPPMIDTIAGDTYIEAFGRLCPDVPVFGTIAVSDSIAFDNCFTLCEGKSFRDSMAFILVAGNVSPRFFISTVDNKNKMPYSGEITLSSRNVIKEINGESAYNYFKGIGLARDGQLDEGLRFVPVLIDFKGREDYDAVPVVRAIVRLDENGNAVCRGHMYQNSIFTIINPTADDIFKSSVAIAKQLLSLANRQATLIFSCFVRRMTFGVEPQTEVEMIAQRLNGGAPFMMAYAGGELCPTSLRASGAVNRFHNFSIIACVL